MDWCEIDGIRYRVPGTTNTETRGKTTTVKRRLRSAIEKINKYAKEDDHKITSEIREKLFKYVIDRGQNFYKVIEISPSSSSCENCNKQHNTKEHETQEENPLEYLEDETIISNYLKTDKNAIIRPPGGQPRTGTARIIKKITEPEKPTEIPAIEPIYNITNEKAKKFAKIYIDSKQQQKEQQTSKNEIINSDNSNIIKNKQIETPKNKIIEQPKTPQQNEKIIIKRGGNRSAFFE